MKKILSCLFATTMLAFGSLSAQTRFVSEEASNRKALLEEYTGIHCGYCPDGHAIANDILAANPGNVFAINIHCGGYAAPSGSELDLRTEFGDALMNNAGISGFPAGTVSRHAFSGSSIEVDRGQWRNRVSQILNMSSYVNIAAKGTLNWQTRELEVTVQLYYTGASPKETNYIHVAMLQDNIIGTQSNYGNYNPSQILPGGKYVHHHALRHLITGQWGDEVTTTTSGSFVEKKYTYTIPTTIRNVATELIDLNFVAFVSETKNEVMNACKVQIENQNSPEHYLSLGNMQQAEDLACDASAKVSLDVNTLIANSPITSITFAFETSAGITEYEYKPEAALEQDTTVTVTSDAIKLGVVNKAETVTAKIIKVNGEEYKYAAEATTDVTKNIGVTSDEDISINIWQDKYGSDITWELVQADNGTVLASGGPYPDLSSNTTVQRTTDVKLAASCYAFTIYDAHKDGINGSYGKGHVSIDDSKGAFIENDGKYKASWKCMVRKSGVGNEKLQSRNALRVQPNPASNYSVLSFDLPAAQSVQVRILASNGACVLDLGKKHLNAGAQTIELPLEKLNDGLYFISVQGKKLNMNQKLVIAR